MPSKHHATPTFSFILAIIHNANGQGESWWNNFNVRSKSSSYSNTIKVLQMFDIHWRGFGACTKIPIVKWLWNRDSFSPGDEKSRGKWSYQEEYHHNTWKVTHGLLWDALDLSATVKSWLQDINILLYLCSIGNAGKMETDLSLYNLINPGGDNSFFSRFLLITHSPG